jgi:hypothetical protein
MSKRVDSILYEGWYAIKANPVPESEMWSPSCIAQLDCWFLHLPGINPFFPELSYSDYVVTGISFSRIPEGLGVGRDFPGATHEIIVGTIDPRVSLKVLEGRTNRRDLVILLPLNYRVQMATSDRKCNLTIEELAIDFINGDLFIESEGFKKAKRMFKRKVRKALTL